MKYYHWDVVIKHRPQEKATKQIFNPLPHRASSILPRPGNTRKLLSHSFFFFVVVVVVFLMLSGLLNVFQQMEKKINLLFSCSCRLLQNPSH